MKVYSMYDRASGLYNNPMCCINDSVAVRTVSMSLNADTPVVAYEDYDLVCLGNFDENTGELSGDKISTVAHVIDIYNKIKGENK